MLGSAKFLSSSDVLARLKTTACLADVLTHARTGTFTESAHRFGDP